MMTKKVLITGVAGFIGYSVAKKLVSGSNVEIIGLDNLNNYYDQQLKFDRLEDLGIDCSLLQEEQLVKSNSYPSLSYIKMDIENYSGLEQLFSSEKITHVIHLAAQAGVRYSLENPLLYIDSNVKGYVSMLECARKHDIKHLVYASSSSVYGLNSTSPFSEQEHTDFPISLYAATKRSNELIAHTYHHLYKLPITGLRFFTVYGPWGRPDMAPMLFANAIKANKPIRIFNYGKMRRDFTYIDDIVTGILKVLELNGSGKIYNIGNSHPIDLMYFIQLMEKELGIEAKKELLPMQPGDVYETYADTTLLCNDTGYKPTTTLEEGVKKFLKWYNEYYQYTSLEKTLSKK